MTPAQFNTIRRLVRKFFVLNSVNHRLTTYSLDQENGEELTITVHIDGSPVLITMETADDIALAVASYDADFLYNYGTSFYFEDNQNYSVGEYLESINTLTLTNIAIGHFILNNQQLKAA